MDNDLNFDQIFQHPDENFLEAADESIKDTYADFDDYDDVGNEPLEEISDYFDDLSSFQQSEEA